MWSDDPVRDFLRYDSDQEDRLQELPQCWNCGEPIRQEEAICVDGKWICDRCMVDLRMPVEEE